MSEVSISVSDSPIGLRIYDKNDRAQVQLLADEPPTVEAGAPDFTVPVDETVRVEAVDVLRIPFWVDAFARDEDREIVATWGDEGEIDIVAPGYLELGGLDVKAYLYVSEGSSRCR